MTTALSGAEHIAPAEEEIIVLDDGASPPNDTPPPSEPSRPRRFADLEEGDEAYGAKVQKRISQTLSQRNAARAEAKRERDQRLQLEREMADLRRTALEATEAAVTRGHDDARARYQRAFADADAEGAATAMAEMTELAARRTEVQQSRQRAEAAKPTEQAGQPQVSAETQAYIDENPWFESDPLARTAAINAHALAARRGIKADTPEYFAHITQAVKAQFPEHFEDLIDPEPEPPRQAAPVPPIAPARRTPPGGAPQPANRLPSLTREEADFAVQCGMTHREYAIQKMKIAQAERKN